MNDHVNTVLGRLKTDQLGRTLIHEHVLIGMPGWFMDARQPAFKRSEAVKRVVDAFQELHGHGVRTVLDPCPMDLGRDVEICAEVSQKTGINLISTTGAYVEKMGIPYTLRDMEVEAITESFVKEIEVGVGDTGIRCGAIKVATGENVVSPYERKILTAAARASKITGVPLISHTEKATCGHDQIDIATGEGLTASSLIVGHSDGRDDPNYQKALAARGSYVGFDRFGLEEGIVPDTVRMENLMQLAKAGHRDRIMVSHDSVACLKGTAGGLDLDGMLKVYPNWRMTHLFENIFPQLKLMGMTDTDIDALVVENPRRYFEQAAAGCGSH
jgi:phosphotriesterase-related protein